MRLLAAGLLLLISASKLDAQAAAPKFDLTAAKWLGGCWEMRMGPSITQEFWMAPSGGAMLGVSRSVVRDTVRQWEHLILGPTRAGLAYTAKPSGQAETAFAATVISDTLLVFENPAHDFPQRILYRRRGADSVIARIEGPRGGQMRGMDLPFARIACPTGR